MHTMLLRNKWVANPVRYMYLEMAAHFKEHYYDCRST